MEPIVLGFSSLLRYLFTPNCLPCPFLLLSTQSGLFLAAVPQALSTGTVVLANSCRGTLEQLHMVVAWKHVGWLFLERVLLGVNLVCSVSAFPYTRCYEHCGGHLGPLGLGLSQQQSSRHTRSSDSLGLPPVTLCLQGGGIYTGSCSPVCPPKVLTQCLGEAC